MVYSIPITKQFLDQCEFFHTGVPEGSGLFITPPIIVTPLSPPLEDCNQYDANYVKTTDMPLLGIKLLVQFAMDARAMVVGGQLHGEYPDIQTYLTSQDIANIYTFRKMIKAQDQTGAEFPWYTVSKEWTEENYGFTIPSDEILGRNYYNDDFAEGPKTWTRYPNPEGETLFRYPFTQAVSQIADANVTGQGWQLLRSKKSFEGGSSLTNRLAYPLIMHGGDAAPSQLLTLGINTEVSVTRAEETSVYHLMPGFWENNVSALKARKWYVPDLFKPFFTPSIQLTNYASFGFGFAIGWFGLSPLVAGG